MNKKSKSVVIALIVLLTLVSTAVLISCGTGESSSGPLPPIKIGYSEYPYPPLHYYANDELIGFDIELARLAANIMGYEPEFIPINWLENAAILESGEVDMLWGGLERASLDESIVAFTAPYLQSNIILLMNDDRDYNAFEDLQGLDICALNFTPAFHYMNVYGRDVIKSQRSYTPPEYEELLDALSSGEFDCLVTDTSFASFFLGINGDEGYRMSDVLIGSNYAVGVRAGDTETLDALQDALNELSESGVIAELAERWIR